MIGPILARRVLFGPFRDEATARAFTRLRARRAARTHAIERLGHLRVVRIARTRARALAEAPFAARFDRGERDLPFEAEWSAWNCARGKLEMGDDPPPSTRERRSKRCASSRI